MAESYFHRLVSQLYFEKVKHDIQAGRYQIIELHGHTNRFTRDRVVNSLRKAQEITTFVSSPKTGLCHILRRDYINSVIERLREMGIEASRNDIYRILGARYVRKQFGKNPPTVVKFYCAPVPNNIRNMLFSKKRIINSIS